MIDSGNEMNDIVSPVHSVHRLFKPVGVGTHAEVVCAVIVDQDGNPKASGADRELRITSYAVKQAWTGAAIGNVVRLTDTLDVSGATTTVVSVLWENLSAGTEIAAPPNVPGYLEALNQGNALTLAQLLSAGLATASNQVSQIGYLADLADGNDRFGAYKLAQSEDLGAGTKYILKSDGTGWLMIRKTYTDTASTMSYASVRNNPTVTTASAAWTGRASLVYGELSAA